MKLSHLIASVTSTLLFVSAPSFAQSFKIDASHTYPSFEADHKGLSLWRGKFNQTSGSIVLDRAAKKGTLDITIEANSIDFGHDDMNKHATSKDIFNVAQFPKITYKGTAIQFDGDKPVSVDGELTLLGVTKPVKLTINKFKCIQNAVKKVETCGADASAEFKRTDFGLSVGIEWGFAPEVKLAIQVEANAAMN